MPNNRVFYASQGIKVNNTTVHGAQSVGITTNFNLEQVFQLGQLAIYDNVSLDPEVEITVNKVLDGEDTVWYLATGGGSIISNANDESTVVIGVGSDTSNSLTSTSAITCSGMFISSISYTIPVDGNMTEDVTFVGNTKVISGSVTAPATSGNNVLRRQNVKLSECTLPTEVSSQNLSSITISADLGRESMYKLGSLKPFHRFVNFPLEITCEFEVIATGLDTTPIDTPTTECSGLTATEQAIVIKLCDSDGSIAYTFDLGAKNKLQSVNYSGGDTGGGNATLTYSYVTYNELTITG